MTKVALGSVSHGTLRSEDLIDVFAGILANHRGYRRLAQKGRSLIKAQDEEAMSCFLDEKLFPALEELAPPFAYFGAHEGDGSDFGFWPDIEALEEAARDEDEVVRVLAGDAWPSDLPQHVKFVMEVNDHGNVSLFHRANRQLVWDVV